MRLARPRVLIVAAALLLAAGGLATWTQTAPTSPATQEAAAVTSVGPAPVADAGAPLTETCSRRVGCLLR